jgi:hypothetical protein
LFRNNLGTWITQGYIPGGFTMVCGGYLRVILVEWPKGYIPDGLTMVCGGDLGVISIWCSWWFNYVPPFCKNFSRITKCFCFEKT